jgi:hypothetical protein
MALKSGTIHVTKTRTLIIEPPVAGCWVHLFNFNEETDRPAYVGDSTVTSGSGIPIYGGAVPRLPYSLFIEPLAGLYAISDEGKDCWIGYLKTP